MDNSKNPTRTIKINAFNSIGYTVDYCAKSQNLEVLDNAFKSAFLDLEQCLKDLSKKTENAMEAFSLIYEDNSRYLMVKDILRQLLGKLTSNIEICAFDSAYQDKNRKYQDSVLAMTRDDQPNAIAFYKSFFDTENEAMEDKGSILIHEIAHLIGLKSDKETKALKSAECVRNFLLLSTGKVTADELFITEAQAKEKEESGEIPEKIPTRAGEHLYSPDQPRVPAGSSTGGQWTSDGSNGGSSKDDDESSSDSDDSSENNENSDTAKEENTETQETEEEREAREENEKIYNELKEGVREILESEGMSEEEIEETLDNISLDEIEEITDRASDSLKSEIEEKLKDIDPTFIASTNNSIAAEAANKNTDLSKTEGEIDGNNDNEGNPKNNATKEDSTADGGSNKEAENKTDKESKEEESNEENSSSNNSDNKNSSRKDKIKRNKEDKNPFESSNPNNIKIGDKEYEKDTLSTGFDGKKLSVYSNNEEIYSVPAVSGIEGFQSKEYQSVKNAGPIPDWEIIH